MEQAWELVKRADISLPAIAPISVFLVSSPTKLIEYMVMAKCIIANELPEQYRMMRVSGAGRCIPCGEQAFADEISCLLDGPERA
jgi:hypothetical protein